MSFRFSIVLLSAVLVGSASAVDEATRLETAAYLSEQLDAVLQAGEQPAVWLTIFGERKTYHVLAVDSKMLTVDVQKNPFPLRWAEISAEDLAGIAKSIAADKGERMVVAAEVAMMLGFSEKAHDILSQIRNPDDALKEKVINLSARISKTQPAAPTQASTAAPSTTNTISPPASDSATKTVYVPPASQQPITGPVINVGPTRAFKTIASGLAKAKAGDTVLVDPGVYKEAVKMHNKGQPNAPVTLRGMVGTGGERPVLDCAGVSVSGAGPTPRAGIQIEGEYCIVDSFEVKNARNGNNGAGARFINSVRGVLRNCKITYCDMGIMGGDTDTGLIERCEIAYNGTKDFNGYSHNFYLNANAMIIRECYIHDSLFGQNFKTRGHYTELWYNFIADSEEGEMGFMESEDTAKPNSNAVLVGNVIVSKAARKGNPTKFIDFGAEKGSRNGNLYLINNTLVAATTHNLFVWVEKPDEALFASNNIFIGSPKILEVASGKIKGLNNCVHGGAAPQLTNNLGADPLFANAAGRDFHLQGSSPCANNAATGDALGYTDGSGKALKAVVDRELVFPMNSRPRAKKSTLDIGAFGL